MAVIDMPPGGSKGGMLDAALESEAEGDFDLRQRPANPTEWTCIEVGDWLVEKGFEQYRTTFLTNDVSGQVLMKMDRVILAELVPSLGHRISLLDEIECLRGPKVPRHVGEGMVGGITGFASKFMYGLNHLVSDPIEGASREGVSGLVKGIGTGITGAIQYPVEGVALFSKQLGDGFRYTPDTIFGSNTPTHALPHTQIEVPLQPKPAHLGEGLVMGFRKLGSGVYEGVTGLVTEPLFAAAVSSRENQTNQSFAVARGFAKGLTGALCKPVAGTFDFASSTVEGLIATPEAIMAATMDGPSIQDTPTFQRLANLRLPSAEVIRQNIGMRARSDSEVVAQIDELRQNNRKENNSE